MVGCDPFVVADIEPFLALAREQGWISDRWEFDFMLRCFPQGCFAWRDNGGTLGYLTSIRYGKSGWIGNVLVRPEARRHGIGRALLERAVAVLLKSGVETVWLTASEDGAGLYRKLGFTPIDHVRRWSGTGSLNTGARPEALDLQSVRAMDRVGWGDRRELLLQETCRRGRLYTSSAGFLCCQQWSSGTQIGPWSCLIPAQAGALLDRLFIPGDDRFFLDVPAGNFAAGSLLSGRGFSVTGSNLLMYLGDVPLYQPGTIYALASMGSIG